MSDYKCPQQYDCSGPRDCLYQNPESCSTFIQCIPKIVANVLPCPDELEWNDKLKMCDWPESANCGKNV